MKIQVYRPISPGARSQGDKNHDSGQYNQSGQHNQSGFALVATVSMMVLLTLIALAMLSLSTIEQRSSGENDEAMRTAQANARMALMIALGELQEAAGPDQRVTATASILGNSGNSYAGGTTAQNGRVHWAGVWDTSNYSPADPDNKTFVRWLVSGSETAVDGIDDAGTAPASDDVVIFENVKVESGVIVPDPDGAGSVKVPKVEVASTGGKTSYYAYWVEDEGVKRDMTWNHIEAASASSTDQDRAQARLLGAVSGPNYWLSIGVGGLGPFRDPNDDGITSDAIAYVSRPKENFPYDAMEKVINLSDVPLAADGGAAHRNWLKGVRHSLTINNRGVFADVKKGGLRRDLSLAFEMDDNKDVSASDQPTFFNQQVGEFVGSGNTSQDQLSAPNTALGMPVPERFLYRYTPNDGTPFASDLTRADSVVRGPNWWAMRDYYNLYKRLKADGANYTIDARAYYPNVSALTSNERHKYVMGNMYGANSGADTYDHEQYLGATWRVPSGGTYLYKPARANTAPVILGSTALYSALASGATNDLSLGIDPFFYIWNPYNRKIKVESIAIKLTTFAGHITFWVEKADGTKTRYGPVTISEYLKYHVGGGGSWNITYLVRDRDSSNQPIPLTLDPGEIVVVSPKSNRTADETEYHDAAYPGTNTDNESGAILTSMPEITVTDGVDNISWKKVPLTLDDPGTLDVDESDQVSFLYEVRYSPKNEAGNPAGNTPMAEHFWINSHLPLPGKTPKSMDNVYNRGDQLQQIGQNAQGDNSVPEYFDPPRPAPGTPLSPPTSTVSAGELPGQKRFFGIGSYLTKGAAHMQLDENLSELGHRHPVEVFTQFNQFPTAGYNDHWRPSMLSQTFTSIADPGDADALLLRAGQRFPASSSRSGYWGQSYEGGVTAVPLLNIPPSPMTSLAAFKDANLTIGPHQPMRIVGNSASSAFVSPVSPFGKAQGMSWKNATASDASWLINDALFDRYFLSGIAPEYTIGTGGYNATGSLKTTLDNFYGVTGTGYKDAQPSPAIVPYIPAGKTAEDVVNELLETQLDDADNKTPGYKKMAAYSLQKGSFNINCADEAAWNSFIRRSITGLDIKFTDGTTDSRINYLGFPPSVSPTPPISGEGAREDYNHTWSGWSRFKNLRDEIHPLMKAIAAEVKARGPFMSLSDFVNHRVGTPKTDANYKGALQAAIDSVSTINSPVDTSAGGVAPIYSGDIGKYFPDPPPVGSNKTTNGIAGSLTQANILLALAPHMTVRSDTFRIRGYGEVRDASDNIIASAMCEALVQRLPEYVDPDTNPDYNEPWDDYDPDETDPTKTLNDTNQKYGRRFEIRSFRWLDESEI